MKITNKTLSDSITALQQIAQLDLDTEVSFELASKLLILQDAARAYNKIKETLIVKGAKRDQDGKMIVVGDGRIELTDAGVIEIEKLDSIEIDVDVEPLMFASLRGQKIKPATLMSLTWFIKK